ncbi:hypothetical protein D3C84_853420 [compost metagenome]
MRRKICQSFVYPTIDNSEVAILHTSRQSTSEYWRAKAPIKYYRYSNIYLGAKHTHLQFDQAVFLSQYLPYWDLLA